MILAHYRGDWAIAYRAYYPPQPRPPGCALRVRNTSVLANDDAGFEPNAFGTYWESSTRWTDELRLFPEIRYHGCKVYPYGWHTTAREPMLQIFADDIDASKYFKANPLANTTDLRRALIADGWDWDAREGGFKYVHVDELEKIEGPPPEGPF